MLDTGTMDEMDGCMETRGSLEEARYVHTVWSTSIMCMWSMPKISKLAYGVTVVTFIGVLRRLDWTYDCRPSTQNCQ